MHIRMRFAASAAAVLTLFTIGAAAGPSYAAPTPPPAGTGVALPAPVTTTEPVRKPLPFVGTPSKSDCAAVTAAPGTFRRAGFDQAGCLTSAPQGRAALAPVSCSGGTTSTYYPGRFSLCLNAHRRTYQTVNSAGTVTGTATVEISTDMVLAANRLTWNETWYATLVAATGRLTTMSFVMNVNCGAGCTTRYAPPNAQSTTVGKTVSGTTTYSSLPAGRSEYVPAYSLIATNPGNDALPVNTWNAPATAAIRCDRVITPAGCANVWWIPWFNVSFARSAQVYYSMWFAQNRVPDKWGASGYVVRRMHDTALQQTSHQYVCDTTFVPQDIVPADTCFDFPHGSNYENGYLLGVSSPQQDCAEFRIGQNPTTGAWTIYHTGSNDGTERCLRSHVAQADVDAYYQSLNNFVVSQRLLDNDGYLVGLVA